MPQEIRKRGKRHKKPAHEAEPPDDHADQGPSWIVSPTKPDELTSPDAPYGFVDVDVKTYEGWRDENVIRSLWQPVDTGSLAGHFTRKVLKLERLVADADDSDDDADKRNEKAKRLWGS